MDHWPVQDAKARFSEFIERCLTKGPQMITRRGAETAVLVSAEQWRRLQSERPTLKELLLTKEVRMDIPVPSRTRFRRRKVEVLG